MEKTIVSSVINELVIFLDLRLDKTKLHTRPHVYMAMFSDEVYAVVERSPTQVHVYHHLIGPMLYNFCQ